jgi:hypothetical protein
MLQPGGNCEIHGIRVNSKNGEAKFIERNAKLTITGIDESEFLVSTVG